MTCRRGRATVHFDFDEARSYEGRVYITSSAAGERAQESDEIQGSVFTHYLLAGLRGAADDSGDRRVSLEEAYRFAALELCRLSACRCSAKACTVDLTEGDLSLDLTVDAAHGALLGTSDLGRIEAVRQ